MKTHERKFRLFARLQELGFTYAESAQLRRIEMTLQRWAERECGDENGNAIERDEVTGKPYLTYDEGLNGKRGRYAIADREKGALRRLKAIVEACNTRAERHPLNSDYLLSYHQGDCRGAMLYILTREQLTGDENRLLDADQYYTRGLAVCA